MLMLMPLLPLRCCHFRRHYDAATPCYARHYATPTFMLPPDAFAIFLRARYDAFASIITIRAIASPSRHFHYADMIAHAYYAMLL